MLSLGPGSACDVCLEPFGAELKAPCSIACGHVFCVSCLQHIARPTCPLCRTHFEARNTIRLHIDLDSIRAPPSTDALVVSSSNDEGARHFQQRITDVAVGGATEAQTTQLTEECKSFLDTVPKTMYSDLRTAYKMLYYMCYVKRLYVDQGRTVNQLTRNVSSLTQEVDRLKAAIEVLKIEKRRLEQAWQTVSAERDQTSAECQKLHEQLDEAEAQIRFVTEQNETAQNQLVLLTEELQHLRAQDEFSSPDDSLDFPPDLPPSTSPDPHWQHTSLNLDPDSDNHDPTARFLTPWEGFTERKALSDADLPEDPEPEPEQTPPSAQCKPNGGYCGAAGCPHSCDCMPFVLFSPGSREAAAASAAHTSTSDAPSMSGLFAQGAPSGLSLSLNKERARSSSRSRPRSRSLSRASSPAPGPSDPPPAGPVPSMSSSINIPNHHQELRGQLKDLLRDPPTSSSLPNMSSSHFLPSPLSRDIRYGANSPLYTTPTKDRSAGKPRDGFLHPPMLSHSSTPSPLHTSTALADPASSQRPSLLRMASNTSQPSQAPDERDRERRRADRARASPTIAAEARPAPMPRPQTHSATPVLPPSSQAPASVHPPMLRPEVSSLRLASPAIPMPRPQTHGGPLPSPPIPSPSNVHQPQHPMPRAQAHGGQPSVPSPTNAHHPQSRAQAHAQPLPSPTKPTTSSSSSSQPRSSRTHASSGSTNSTNAYNTHPTDGLYAKRPLAPAMATPGRVVYA